MIDEKVLADRLGLGKPRTLSQLIVEFDEEVASLRGQAEASEGKAKETSLRLIGELGATLRTVVEKPELAEQVGIIREQVGNLGKIMVILEEIRVGLSAKQVNAELEREVLEKLRSRLR